MFPFHKEETGVLRDKPLAHIPTGPGGTEARSVRDFGAESTAFPAREKAGVEPGSHLLFSSLWKSWHLP